MDNKGKGAELLCFQVVGFKTECVSTLLRHFIRSTILFKGWSNFRLQNHFNTVLETFLRNFGPY